MIDDTIMNEQIEAIRNHLRQSSRLQRFNRLAIGLQRLILFFWWIIGRIDSYFVCSGFFIFVGFTQLAIVNSSVPAGGLTVIEQTVNIPGGMVALIFVTMGWLIGYTRSAALLTTGAFILFGYAGALIYGTFNHTVDLRGYLAAIYIIFGTLGFWRASYAEMQRDKYERALASVKASKELVSDGAVLKTGN